jgi:hypothetical protein
MTTKRGAKMTSGRPDPVLQRPWQCRLQRREILARCASREPHGLADRYSASLVISSAAGILAIDISDWFGADRKIDRTATVPTMARREQARMPESERVSAARRALSFKGPLHRRFQRTGSTRFIRDLVRDDGKARQSCGTECR